jgi:hypothetical protein
VTPAELGARETMSDGRHADQSDLRRRRRRLFALVLAIVVLAAGGGLLAAGLAGDQTDASASQTVSPGATRSEPASPNVSTSPTTTASPTIAPPLEDGRHFGMITDAEQDHGGASLLVFDLAYFLTGEEANQEAAADGVQTPVPNDYYIVNDNPRLRRLPLAAEVDVRYIPQDRCCDLQPGR